MAWTVATFKEGYPEFEPTDETLVQNALDSAALECDSRVFGPLTDYAVGLKAAHKLATSPFGQNTRKKSLPMVTTYSITFDELAQSKAGGPWPI